MEFFVQAAIFLAAALIAVPAARLAGLSSVLGYLIAGAIIGPWGLGLFHETEEILHFSEFGVVLLMFIIGLELHPKRLMAMRRMIFGMGTAQVLLSALLIGLVALVLGQTLVTAVIAGLALALSSTAFALQLLAERKQLGARHGRAAFSILLFQDMAAIPIIALVPLLGAGGMEGSPLVGALSAIAALAVIILAGRYLLRFPLKLVASLEMPELFSAFGLLIVIGTALIVSAAGLSMALGAFLAGVLLATSEYRHEIEADINPFKDLLLGLFFIAVGMSINFQWLLDAPATVATLVAGLLALKAAVLFGVARAFGLGAGPSLSLAAVIPQGGEFAFVILGGAVAAGAVAQDLSDLLILVVTLSMAATPLIVIAEERLRSEPEENPAYDEMPGDTAPVIIAGFGRVGQIVGRLLSAKGIPFTALEIDATQVDFVKRFGNEVHYGDASRLELLRAARAKDAKIFVLAIDDVEASLKTARTVREHFPELRVFARARNRQHAYDLMDLGIMDVQRETFLSSLDLARAAVEGLGHPPAKARQAVELFKENDVKRLNDNHGRHKDEKQMQEAARTAAKEFEELFAQDALQYRDDEKPL